MRFDVLTLFPDLFQGYFTQSLLKLAIQRGLVEICLWNIRDWAKGKHKSVDDRPFGGGPGMVILPEPVFDAVESVQAKVAEPGLVVMLTPGGERLTQNVVRELAAHKRLLLLCGRYEGFDERIRLGLKPREISKKLEKGDFNLNDFRKQFEQMAKMGGMKDIMSNMPGMGDLIPDGEDPDLAVKRIQGMIDSMTKEERKNPDIIDLSRRRRIAEGSGTEPHDIKQFINQFEQVRTVMRQIANMSLMDRLKMVMGMGKAGALSPGGMMPKTKIGTGHRKTPKERAEERKKKRKQDKKRK